MLAALPENLVLSEPGPVDSILRAQLWNPKFDENQRITWLRWIVSALGQPQTTGQKNYFIKFDAVNTLEIALIIKAFPDVPWIFVQREPMEVIVSNMRQLAGKMMPGAVPPAWFGCNLVEALQMTREEYCARALGKYCQSVIAQLRGRGGQIINYSQLPDGVFTLIRRHFNQTWSGSEMEVMREVTRLNIKEPSQPFVADAAKKRSEAGELVRQVTEQWVRPYYDRLEAVRQSASG
jgi:hypothetical protein